MWTNKFSGLYVIKMNVKELIEELQKYDQNMMVGVWLGYYDSHGKFIETRESISLSEHYDEENEEWFIWIG